MPTKSRLSSTPMDENVCVSPRILGMKLDATGLLRLLSRLGGESMFWLTTPVLW